MNQARSILLALSMLCVPALAENAPFPSAPPNLKEVQAAQLQRVTIAELKQLFPGSIEQKRSRGGRVKKEFRADGTLQASTMETARPGGATDWSSTWHIEKKKGGGVYCVASNPETKGGCYAVFKAGDGVHYFEYTVHDGFFAAVWRPVKN
jgi:hypothetical protein